MAENKKSALLQAVSKIKGAKKNLSTTQNDNKGINETNAAGSAIAGKIKDAVKKFDRD